MFARLVLVLVLLAVPARAEDEAWRRYDAALEKWAAGEAEQALAALADVRLHYPDHPAAVFAGEAERLIEARRTGKLAPADERRLALMLQPAVKETPAGKAITREELARTLRTETPTSFARAELAFLQTINGVGFGVGVCLLARCDDVRLGVSSALIGGAGGLAASLYFTEAGITPGRALAINSGAAWGAWNGLAAANLIDETQNGPDPQFAAFLALQLAGTLGGLLLADNLEPSAGDVSLANFGGIWSGVFYLLIRSAAEWNSTDDVFWLTFAAATDVGLALGALATRWFPMSRGRVYVLDAGGILGLLLGFASVVLVNGPGSLPETAFFTAGAVGAAGGIALAAYLTREWDVPEGRVLTALAPTEGGAMLVSGVRW